MVIVHSHYTLTYCCLKYTVIVRWFFSFYKNSIAIQWHIDIYSTRYTKILYSLFFYTKNHLAFFFDGQCSQKEINDIFGVARKKLSKCDIYKIVQNM